MAEQLVYLTCACLALIIWSGKARSVSDPLVIKGAICALQAAMSLYWVGTSNAWTVNMLASDITTLALAILAYVQGVDKVLPIRVLLTVVEAANTARATVTLHWVWAGCTFAQASLACDSASRAHTLRTWVTLESELMLILVHNSTIKAI